MLNSQIARYQMPIMTTPGDETQPEWAVNGGGANPILFTRSGAGGSRIWRVGPDGSNEEQVTTGGGNPAAPKFPVATALRFLQTSLVRETADGASAVADRALAADDRHPGLGAGQAAGDPRPRLGRGPLHGRGLDVGHLGDRRGPNRWLARG